jgi:hypothetical protein
VVLSAANRAAIRQLFAFGPEAKNADDAARAYDAHIGADGWPAN